MRSSDNLETVNVRLPDEIIKVLDTLVARGLFANRSEAIRDFCREYALESQQGKTQSIGASTTTNSGGAR